MEIQLVAVDADIPGVGDLPEVGVLHGAGHEPRHIVGGGVMILRVQTVGIGEVGVVHAELGGIVVHPADEGGLVSAHRTGQRRGGIVAGVHHQAVEQAANGHRLPHPQVHGRAFHVRPLLLHDDGGVQIRRFFQRHQRRHDLRGAGDQVALLRVALIEHLPGPGIGQNGALGGDVQPVGVNIGRHRVLPHHGRRFLLRNGKGIARKDNAPCQHQRRQAAHKISSHLKLTSCKAH